mmetsp:Transcript_83777/g.130709  ORF Transcript_83777/g.130709 Transcript_83777/m.130709 type:complete len:264 (+) Transcript_83777:68-859(+)
MALRSAIDKFHTPREVEQLKCGQVDDAEAAHCNVSQALSPLVMTIALNELVPERQVEESNCCEYDSDDSTAPSTPDRKPACSTSQTLCSLALQISLDELLTQSKFDTCQSGEGVPDTSTTLHKPAKRPGLVLHDNTPTIGDIVVPHASRNPRDQTLLLSADYQFKSKLRPKSLLAGMPSRGSKNHCLGKCRPCKFVQAGKECPHGVLCNFCHAPHQEIRRKVARDCAFLTTDAPKTKNNTQCEPYLSALAESSPWYVHLTHGA